MPTHVESAMITKARKNS